MGTKIDKTRVRNKHFQKIAIYTFMVASAMFFLFPIYFTVFTAFKDRVLAFASPPVWLFRPSLSNFTSVLLKVGFSQAFFNSLTVALGSALLSSLLGVPAAYILARCEFRLRSNLVTWILSTRMAPPIAVVIPFFVIVNKLHLYDTKLALIAIYTVFNLPLSIWVMRSFIVEIPTELDEAASMDGANTPTVFARIIFPLCKPGLAVTMILCFIFSWNEFLLAMILTGRAAKTLPIMVTGYIQQTRGILWAEMSAASVLIMLPLLILTLFIQKYLVRGLTFGTIK